MEIGIEFTDIFRKAESVNAESLHCFSPSRYQERVSSIVLDLVLTRGYVPA